MTKIGLTYVVCEVLERDRRRAEPGPVLETTGEETDDVVDVGRVRATGCIERPKEY